MTSLAFTLRVVSVIGTKVTVCGDSLHRGKVGICERKTARKFVVRLDDGTVVYASAVGAA